VRSLPSRVFVASALLLALGVTMLVADSGPDHQVRQDRPISLGTSGGNVNDITTAFCCSGTLGALVTKNGVDYILSNNHVLARTSQAAVGEDVSQPGRIDNGCRVGPNDIVADLSEYAPLGGATNVDAAIAQVRTGAVSRRGEILDIGIPADAPALPTIGRGVAKSGRTTGLTCSSITSVSTDVSIMYQLNCNSGRRFFVNYTDQVIVGGAPFSAGGDSGSLIVTSDTAQPVGLLYAGSSTSTIANPIQDVIAALGVSFVRGRTHAVSCPATAAQDTSQFAGPSPSEMARARAVKNARARGLMQHPAVQGVGIGAHPDRPGEAVLVIYLEAGRPAPAIPAMIDGVSTHVIRTDRFRAFGWNEPQAAPAACSAK
jgi:hypothetical protein